MLNRKLKKLIRDPKLFFSDMKKKRKAKENKNNNKKKIGNYQYTVVSAVYNVDRYLDKYLKSLVGQKLDFKRNIFLVLVDDGSTDDSANTIKKWQKKYPENIFYVSQENGGQASARNTGLKYAKTEWVTFIDPDDFVDENYFLQVDDFCENNEKNNLKLISCNFIFYFDDLKIFKDTHPLKYRFEKGDTLTPISNMGKQIQLSVNSAFFRTSILRDFDITFDTDIKPNYEDAEFVTKYIFQINSGNAAFLKSAKYFYRKRSDGTSTLDKAWEKTGLYDDVLVKGCINSMERYKNTERKIPETLQIKVLYHIFWYLKRYINNKQKLSFLSNSQINNFEKLLLKIFSMIDDKVILQFGLAGCWFYHKVGMLSCFKQTVPSFQIVYIESYDPIKKMIELRYFSRSDEIEYITVDEKEIFPLFAKTMRHDFLSREFVKERRVWISIPNNANFNVKISKYPTTITLSGKQYKDGLKTDFIFKTLEQLSPKYDKNPKYINSWLFMDRDVQADDNAEHLYDFIKKNHPEREIYFALNSESSDWTRLKNKDFNLVKIGSEEHQDILKNCSKLISSHADGYVTNYLGPRMMHGRHFVFLQHGVIHNDLSDWLNQKEKIDLFITTSPAEYEAITGNDTYYKFTDKNVKLTGLARHDNLLNKLNTADKTLLIMPTWRNNIVGKSKANSNLREYFPEFENTEYAQHWRRFLDSDKLQELASLHNYKIVFLPHPNIVPYLSSFEIPDYIEIFETKNNSIQEQLIRSSIMITDYSSVAFDMAVLGKQTIYYQFDRMDFFSGSHTLKQGYFDHIKHGFGPVVENQNDLLETLSNILLQNAIPDEVVQSRIDSTFPLRDGRNCERTYEAICDLDKPLDQDSHNVCIIENYATRATNSREWKLAIYRWSTLISLVSGIQKDFARLKLVEALREEGEINLAIETFDQIAISSFDNPTDSYYIEQAKVYMACQNWIHSLNAWNNSHIENSSDHLQFLRCLSELNNYDLFEKKFSSLNNGLTSSQNVIAMAYSFICKKEWNSAIDLLVNNINNFTSSEIITLKPSLILARCYNEINDFVASGKILDNYVTSLKNDINFKYEMMKRSFNVGQFNVVIALLNPKLIDMNLLSTEIILIYLKSLRFTGKNKQALLVSENLKSNIIDNNDIKFEMAENYLSEKHWALAAKLWLELLDYSSRSRYRLAFSYRMLGMIDEALEIITMENTRTPQDINEWRLRGELAHLAGDWNEASLSWLSIIKFYPNEASNEYWDRLNDARLMLSVSNLNKNLSSRYRT